MLFCQSVLANQTYQIMKILLTMFCIISAMCHLYAQDTLFIKGRKTPVLAEIIKVKNRFILYKKYQSSSERVLEINRKRVLDYGLKMTDEQALIDAEELADLNADFIRQPNTIYMSSRGILALNTIGVYYDRNLYTSPSGNLHLGLLTGAGLVNAGEIENEELPEGQFAELGVRAEFGKNRLSFSTGFNARHHRFNAEISETQNTHFGIPFGVSFRSNRGAFFNGGGEFSSLNWAQPLFKLSFGWSF